MAQTVTRPEPSAPRPSSRRRDQYGLPLTTGTAAAAAFRTGLDRLLSLEEGAVEAVTAAVTADPGFALGHAVAATALAEVPDSQPVVAAHLRTARRAAGSATEREASFVAAAVLWCADRQSADDALLRHVRRWPRDAWAVSLVAPSIASTGIAAGVVEVWPLLDDLARHYRADWWLTGLRAFARTEQGRWEEAEDLALCALAARPSAGHAAHARAHVLYETGRHAEGVRWIDGWRAADGSGQRYGCHFSWHAGLCEVGLGRHGAVRRRFDRDLGALAGSRALVDAGSLLARCAAHGHPLGGRRAAAVVEAAGEVVRAPASPFLAWHVAVLAGVGADTDRLDELEALARRRDDGPCRDGWRMVVSVCRAVRAGLCGDPAVAAALLASLGDTTGLGGSPAQRELLDDLCLQALVAAGEREAAAAVAARRLRRRPSAWDRSLCRA